MAPHRVQGVSTWQLRKALVSYSQSKAQGPDAIEVQFLRALPDEIVLFFVAFYRVVSCRGEWPDFVKAVYMAILPKPDGGARTVGKTCMLYRMWARMRFPVTRAWERQRLADWDKAKARSSAGDAAYARSMEAEAAVHCRHHVACNIWDP